MARGGPRRSQEAQEVPAGPRRVPAGLRRVPGGLRRSPGRSPPGLQGDPRASGSPQGFREAPGRSPQGGPRGVGWAARVYMRWEGARRASPSLGVISNIYS